MLTIGHFLASKQLGRVLLISGKDGTIRYYRLSELFPLPARQHVDLIQPLRWSKNGRGVDVWGLDWLRVIRGSSNSVNGATSMDYEGDIPRSAIEHLLSRVNLYLAMHPSPAAAQGSPAGGASSTRAAQWQVARQRIEALQRHEKEAAIGETLHLERSIGRALDKYGGALEIVDPGDGSRFALLRPSWRRRFAEYPIKVYVLIFLLLTLAPSLAYLWANPLVDPIWESLAVLGYLIISLMILVPAIVIFYDRLQFPMDLVIRDDQIIVKEKRIFGKSFIGPLTEVHLEFQSPAQDEIFGTLHISDDASFMKIKVRLITAEIKELKSFIDGKQVRKDVW